MTPFQMKLYMKPKYKTDKRRVSVLKWGKRAQESTTPNRACELWLVLVAVKAKSTIGIFP